MIRRYDLRRSDNYMYTGRVSYVCYGSGTLKVYTGFPVTRATVSFATIPCDATVYVSSSSSSSLSSSSSSTWVKSSSSSSTEWMSSLSTIWMSSSSSSESSSLSTEWMSSSSSSESSSLSTEWMSSSSTEGRSSSSSSYSSSSSSYTEIDTCPRIYVSGYDVDGFYVHYEGITRVMGYIEFTYTAV